MRNKKQIRKRLLFCAGICIVGLASGCQKKVEQTEQKEKEVSIPMILTVDPSSGNKNEEKVVEAFNEVYGGTWEVEVEWVVETEEDYRQNLKRQNVTDTLPALITDLRMLPSFYELMIQDGRIENLAPLIEQDEEWKSMIEPVVLEACTEPDGSIYLAPISTAAFSCSGVFWNEELFAQAGISSFPKTWEEFWNCCEQLQASGITPLAIHTEGTAWAAMLLTTAELADTQEGAAFLKEAYPESYQNEQGIHMAETLQRLFSYTTENALYSDFDVAYENFFSGKAAMIPNGYWMIDQIPEGWEEKTRFSAFPGNKLISSPETFGWALVSGYEENVKEGAIAFLKFRTEQNQKEKEVLFTQDRETLMKAEQDYMAAYEKQPQIVPNYQVKWNSIIQEKTFGEAIPELVTGKISPEEFTRLEDESIRELEKEQ